MKIVDYHVHSTNSFDGKNTIEEMCRKAIEMGLYEICFTEHFSVDPRDVSYGILNYERYDDEIEKAKEKFSGRLHIKKGMEIGEPHLKEYKKDFEENTTHLKTSMLAMQSTHMFIASNHWEDIVVELSEDIPESSLLHFSLVSDAIHVKLPETINNTILHQLTELFPELSGKLRSLYMSGQDVKGVLGGCLVQ